MSDKTWRNAAGVEILIPPEYATHEEYEAALRAENERLQTEVTYLRAELAFDTHLLEHRCDQREGFGYCTEAMRLFRAIPEDRRGAIQGGSASLAEL